MAEDAKAKDKEGAPSDAGSSGRALFHGITAPRRDKPMIEGEALQTEIHASPAAESQPALDEPPKETAEIAAPNHLGTVPGTEPDAALSGSAETAEAEGAEAETAAADTPGAPPPSQGLPPSPRSRAGLWPIAAAIVIGALISVGGAYGLHSLDASPQSLAALEERVAALEHQPEAVAPPQADVSGLNKRISTLQAGAQSVDATLARLQQSLQRLEAAQTLGAHQGSSASLAPNAKSVDLAPLSGRVDKLESAFAALDQKMRDLATQFEAQTQAAQAAKERAAQVATAGAQANAVAILAANLRREAAAGAAFTDDLSALADRDFDKDKLAALAPVAGSGVATPAMLGKQFSAVADDIIATESAPEAEGFFGRLAQDAAHLVRIHKIDDTTGHGLAAHVARIKKALASGAVEAALHEWNDLPTAAKAKSQAFGTAVRRRIDALSMAKAIEADALAALAKVKS